MLRLLTSRGRRFCGASAFKTVNLVLGGPGTLNYEWFIDADGKNGQIYERYADSAATMTHLGAFGEKFAERFMAVLEPTRLLVYGDPSDEVKTPRRDGGPLGGGALVPQCGGPGARVHRLGVVPRHALAVRVKLARSNRRGEGYQGHGRIQRRALPPAGQNPLFGGFGLAEQDGLDA